VRLPNVWPCIAECLALYLSGTSSTVTPEDTKRQETTASWTMVLLGRLESCGNHLQQGLVDSNNNSIGKNKKKEKQWYAVTAPCLHALCLLIETNPEALQQINASPEQKTLLVRVILGILTTIAYSSNSNSSNTAATSMEETTESTAEATPANNSNSKNNTIQFYQEKTALYASRTLHSALDDNPELAHEVLLQSSQQQQHENYLWKKQTTATFPIMTQLHLVGCLVNLFQLSSSSASSSNLEQALLDHVHSCLVPILLSKQESQHYPREWKQLDHDYRQACALYKKQRDDEQLETEIIQKVEQRKEPAREIARRQAQQQQQQVQQQPSNQDDDDDVDMQDATHDANGTTTSSSTTSSSKGKFLTHEQDGQELLHTTLEAWNATMGPLQLALEIVTNLLTCWIPLEGDHPMEYTDSIKKAKQHPLQQTLEGLQFGLGMVHMLQTLCQFDEYYHQQPPPPQIYDNSDDKENPICTDVQEAIGKTCACLSNCLLSGILWSNDHVDTAEDRMVKTWQILMQCLVQKLATMTTTAAATETSSSVVTDGLTSCMVVLLQKQRQGSSPSKAFIRKNDVQVVSQLLLTTSATSDKDTTPRMGIETQRNAVCILSMIVLSGVDGVGKDDDYDMESLVRTLTHTFVNVLLSLSSSSSSSSSAMMSSIPVGTEILNAFMDWYGQDDFYPHVFDEWNVLQAIQQYLAKLQPRQEHLQSVIGPEDEEILYNAQRFVEYKQEQQQFAK